MSDPQVEAARRYAAAYDRLAEDEQVAIAQGWYELAEECRDLAKVAIRAYTAETHDPDPKPTCACGLCQLTRLRRVP